MTDATRPCLGIRANNPGNLEYNDRDKWQGLAEPPYIFNDARTIRYFNFTTAPQGARAIFRVLIHNQDFLHLTTIRQHITRYAPSPENNTRNYIAFVSDKANIGPDTSIDMHNFDDAFPIVKAITRYENGCYPLTDAQLTKAAILAGLEPTNPAPIKGPLTGIQTATIGTAASGALHQLQDNITSANDGLQNMAPYLHIATYGVLALTLCGLAIAAYSYWDEQRKGIRP